MRLFPPFFFSLLAWTRGRNQTRPEREVFRRRRRRYQPRPTNENARSFQPGRLSAARNSLRQNVPGGPQQKTRAVCSSD